MTDRKTGAFMRSAVILPLLLLFCLLPGAAAHAEAPAGAEDAVAEAMRDFGWSLDLSSYDIPVEEADALIYGTLSRHPELFYVYPGYSLSYMDGTVETVYFNYYDYTPQQVDEFEDEVGKITNVMSTLEGDLEKILYAHEYLLKSCEYDYSQTGYTAYDCLVRHKSVCEGYAKAFMLLMQRVGINCRFISSSENDHAWNAVELAGQWYFTDVTWDDTSSTHKHLLNSFSQCVSNGHKNRTGDWTVDYSSSCLASDYTGQDFDNAPWKNARAPMSRLDGKWFFVNDTGLSYYDAADGQYYDTAAVTDRWFVWGSSFRYHLGCFAGTAIFNGKLYYNTPGAIMSVKPDGTEKKTEYTLSSSEAATGYIYGIYADDTGICYELSRSPLGNGLAPVMTGHFEIGTHTHSYTAKVTAPTCTEEGFTTFTCPCGHSYRDSFIPAAGHRYGTTVTKATTTKNGSVKTVCSSCGKVKGTKMIPKPCVPELSAAVFSYSGNAKKPKVTVKDSAGKTLVSGTDYTVSYSDNKNIGKASVKVSFKGNYSGTKTLSFKIVPGKITELKATQTTSSVKLSWAAVKGAKTYRIYKYSSSTGKYTQKYSTTSTGYTVKNLKSGTVYTYYVKASKTVGGVKYQSASYMKIKTATKPSAPKAPTLTAGTKKITAKWSKPADASGCELYMKKGSSGTYKRLCYGTMLTYTKSSLTKGSTYYFKLRSYKTVDGVKIYSAYSYEKGAKVK